MHVSLIIASGSGNKKGDRGHLSYNSPHFDPWFRAAKSTIIYFLSSSINSTLNFMVLKFTLDVKISMIMKIEKLVDYFMVERTVFVWQKRKQ